MIAKARTGVDFFDDRYGGAYRGRSLLVTGKSGSGKSVFSLQFLAKGLRQGERGLLLSGRQAADVVLYAQALGLPLGEAVTTGDLVVLEYSDYVPGKSEAALTVPPDGFVQLQEIISSNGVQRVVLDTCLPWVVTPAGANMAEHVFSFIRAFDRLGTTTLLTLPKPISPIAFRLKSVLEETVPISIVLQKEGEERTWIVSKYLGEARLDEGVPFVIDRGVGIRKAAAASLPPEVAAKTPAPTPAPASAAAVSPDAAGKARVRLANAVLQTKKLGETPPETDTPSPTVQSRTVRWGSFLKP